VEFLTNWIAAVMAHWPTWADLWSAMPTIVSLIMIEGLLSVDNAMAIAAMASSLPPEQQKKALRWGIIGAYGFRGICLALVAWIAENMWLKIFGSAYLIYLMVHALVGQEQKEDSPHGAVKVAGKGLIATIISIEIMDLSLSLDNVVAAVALDSRLWVVCLGVFIGILALRFVAGYCIKLIEKFPILNKTAFLLIGFVGCMLLSELLLGYAGIHFHMNAFQKFLGIAAITGSTLAYGNTAWGRRLFTPVVAVGTPFLRLLNIPFEWVHAVLHFVIELIKKIAIIAYEAVRGFFGRKTPHV
jgi:YkoY family integral membrane protein